MNEKILFDHLKTLEKEELLELLQQAFWETEGKIQRYIFGDIYKKITAVERTPGGLLADIKAFCKKSYQGNWYASFMINSKNFMDVPEETEEWFDIMGDYLQKCVELANQKSYAEAVQGFDLLFALIDKMEEGDEIVFADELGSWMIPGDSVKQNRAYITAVSKTEKANIFAQKMIPLLKRDSIESLSGKVWPLIQEMATKAQKEATQKQVKEKEIRVKKWW